MAMLNTASETVESLRLKMDETASMLPEYPVVMAMNGVDPGKNDSGQHIQKSVPTTKQGSPCLRKTLFQIMDGLIKRSPADDAVYAFMDKKRARGKPYYVYMTASANKFLRIYYGRVKEHLSTLAETEET